MQQKHSVSESKAITRSPVLRARLLPLLLPRASRPIHRRSDRDQLRALQNAGLLGNHSEARGLAYCRDRGGFALPSSSDSPSGSPSGAAGGPEPSKESSTADPASGGLPQPGTKVSETRRRNLLEAGLAEKGEFDRFARYDDPTEKQHFFQLEKTPSPPARP